MPGISRLPPCVEDAETLEANARKKALHCSSYTEEVIFADDSGICVDALGGAPGVYSARFAGPDATDEANNQKLLCELKNLSNPSFRGAEGGPELATGESRTAPIFPAHFECVIAQRAGVSAPSVYAILKSKMGILTELLNRAAFGPFYEVAVREAMGE